MSDQIDENKFYCEKQKQYVDRCPAPRLAMPVKKCEPPIYDEYPTEELLYAEDFPEGLKLLLIQDLIFHVNIQGVKNIRIWLKES